MSEFIKLTHSSGGAVFVRPGAIDAAWSKITKLDDVMHPFPGKKASEAVLSTDNQILVGNSSLGIKESPEVVEALVLESLDAEWDDSFPVASV